MTVITPGATHLAEYLLLLDAKDEPGLCRLMTSDVQHVNEITRRWTRGRAAVGAELRTMFSRLSDLRSSAEDVHVERWGDVEVETFELHQVYDLEGATVRVVAPTTLVWRRTPAGWRLALTASIPTGGG